MGRISGRVHAWGNEPGTFPSCDSEQYNFRGGVKASSTGLGHGIGFGIYAFLQHLVLRLRCPCMKGPSWSFIGGSRRPTLVRFQIHQELIG